jgi:hypothetical protein
MGIEFTGLTDEAKTRFQAHLDKLDPGLPGLGGAPTNSPLP